MGSMYLPLDWNALICFAAKGDLEAVTCLVEGQTSGRADIREMTMVRKRFPPDMMGLYGDTPLHAAANNGHVDVVDFLLNANADASAQNDLGQTPLVCASMQGHDRVVSRLLMGGTDAHRVTIDGKNALQVSASQECRFMLKMLASHEDEEAAKLRAEQAQSRMNLIMLRWAKASMVNAYYTWKNFALIPENKVNRLVMQLDSFALQQTYETPPTGIIHHAIAVDLSASLAGTQLVVYSGKKGLGATDGSGHPLILGIPLDHNAISEVVSETINLFGVRRVAGGRDEEAKEAKTDAKGAGAGQPLAATAAGKIEGADATERSEYAPSYAAMAQTDAGGVAGAAAGKDVGAAVAAGAAGLGSSGRAANIERPVPRYKKHFQELGDAGEKQLKELEGDEWGQRSIATARKWIAELCKQMAVARLLTVKYSYIMDDPRPGSPHTNIQLMQNALLRLLHRLIKPHRAMLHGLRPWAFRSSSVLSSQALVNSREFPPNFPGSPSDRRLYSTRFLHVWAWLVALNNPPSYPALPDLQEQMLDTARVLRLEQHECLRYVCNPAFQPQPEAQRLGTRLHIQPLNLPLPPAYAQQSDAYYAKALSKVEGEPAADAGMRERAKGAARRRDDGLSIAAVFDGSIMIDDPLAEERYGVAQERSERYERCQF